MKFNEGFHHQRKPYFLQTLLLVTLQNRSFT